MNYKIVGGWILSLTPIWLMLFGVAYAFGTWQAYVGVAVGLFTIWAMIYGIELVCRGQAEEYAEELQRKRGGNRET